jgi:hypothetical protein
MKVVCSFFFFFSLDERNSCSRIYWWMNNMDNIDSQIGLIIRSRERRHLFLLLSSFSSMHQSGVSGIENDKTKKESHREWYLNIVQSYIIQRNKKVQIDLICYYRYNITKDIEGMWKKNTQSIEHRLSWNHFLLRCSCCCENMIKVSWCLC